MKVNLENQNKIIHKLYKQYNGNIYNKGIGFGFSFS